MPFLTTLHGRLDLPELLGIYDAFPDVPVVSVSNAQREPLADANYIGTVYYGLPEGLLTAGSGKGEYLAFIRRISPEKSPDVAIRIAGAAGMKLKIAAKIDPVDQEYYDQHILPMLSQPHVEFIGEIDEAHKSSFLGNAAGLLCPISWREPFGLAMIEAMACGTPVIAMRRGSVPEVIDDGVTGFICDTEAEAVDAVQRLPDLDRKLVRRRFEARFTGRRMAMDYVRLYQRLIWARQPWQFEMATQ